MKEQARLWWRQATQMAEEAKPQAGRFDELVQRLANHDPQVAVTATWALQQAGPSAIPALLTGLTDPHTKVRRNCVDIIDHGGYGADGRCLDALLPLLRDPVPHIRRAVWHTLFCERCQDVSKCEVTPTAKLDQVALLIEIGLNDPNPKLRGQLLAELRQHQADERAQLALQQLDSVFVR
jgi:HEAT repeat protein